MLRVVNWWPFACEGLRARVAATRCSLQNESPWFLSVALSHSYLTRVENVEGERIIWDACRLHDYCVGKPSGTGHHRATFQNGIRWNKKWSRAKCLQICVTGKPQYVCFTGPNVEWESSLLVEGWREDHISHPDFFDSRVHHRRAVLLSELWYTTMYSVVEEVFSNPFLIFPVFHMWIERVQGARFIRNQLVPSWFSCLWCQTILDLSIMIPMHQNAKQWQPTL